MECIGFAFAFGDTPAGEGAPNPFIGSRYFALSGIDTSGDYDMRLWFWHFTFSVTASTIVSGAVAERTRLRAYFIFAMYAAFVSFFEYVSISFIVFEES